MKLSKEEKVEQRREEIVQAAYEVFAERGYHSSGIAQIAERLGIGHGTFYRYFQNKLDIFAHVIDRAMTQIAEIVVAEDPDGSDTLEAYRAQVERISDRLFELFRRDAALPQLLFVEALGIDEQISSKVQLALDLAVHYTERYLQNGQAKGFLRPDLDTAVVAQAINAMTFEGARRVVRAEDPPAACAQWKRAVTQLMFEGLAR
ncbi:MAG: TetR/AcrR family transcriptional regulator [Planctomycetes bacterium]|nr:TetR/AcrR family transcriptional regulator [Planctomycetota bacterium]